MTLTYGMWRDCLAGLEVTLPENPFVKTIVGEFCIRNTNRELSITLLLRPLIIRLPELIIIIIIRSMPVGNIGDRVLVIRWLPHLYIIRMETWLLRVTV